MNILVVEDDNLLRRSLGHYLVDTGHTVSVCANGQEALEHLEQNRQVDVLIIDVLMPVLSGASLIILMKKLFPEGLPYIILISAVKEGESFVKQLEVTYDHYMQKPIDFEDLGELILSLQKQKAG